MKLKSVQYVRAEDGTQKVILDLAEFQALLDEVSIAKHGPPDLGMVVDGLRSVRGGESGYVGAGDLWEMWARGGPLGPIEDG